MKRTVLALCSVVVVAPVWAVYPVTVTSVVDPVYTGNILKTATETAATAAKAAEMVRQTKTILEYAGNPKAAVRSLSDLERINRAVKVIVGPEAGADGLLKAGRDLMEANEQINEARRQIEVIGETKKRKSDPSLYDALDAAEALSLGIKEQLHKQQGARKDSADELAKAQQGLKNAGDESAKQAAAAQMQAIATQQAIINGQTQQQALELQLSEAERKRLDQEASIRATAEFDANAEVVRKARAEVVDKDSASNRNALATVEGKPLDFDWSAVR